MPTRTACYAHYYKVVGRSDTHTTYACAFCPATDRVARIS